MNEIIYACGHRLPYREPITSRRECPACRKESSARERKEALTRRQQKEQRQRTEHIQYLTERGRKLVPCVYRCGHKGEKEISIRAPQKETTSSKICPNCAIGIRFGIPSALYDYGKFGEEGKTEGEEEIEGED